MDEADILKTDGTYIYTISNKILSIIRAYPAKKIELLWETEIFGMNPSAIFIEGDYLAVFGTEEYRYYSSRYYAPPTLKTIIRIYDVSNRANPRLVKT